MGKNISFNTIMEYCNGFAKSQIIFTALELDIFSKISDMEPVSADKLCDIMELDVRACSILLNALCSMGLLRKDTLGNYKNEEVTLKYLVSGSESDASAIVCHMADTMKSWKHLTQMVRAGTSPGLLQDDIFGGDKEKTEAFIWGMDNIAKERMQDIMSAISIDPYGKLLDMGGGPGSYGIAFCKRYSMISSVIYDLPLAIEQANKNILKHSMGHRVTTIAGDILKDPLGTDYQTIWCSQFIHCFSSQENKDILKKCYDSMLPGGKIIIHDFILDDLETSPQQGAMFSVHMLVCTKGGKSYSKSKVTSWLRGVGFDSIEIKQINPVSSIVTAFK